MENLDQTDLRLLDALQRDSSRNAAELAEVVHLSPSQISRRRQRLEREGYITGQSCKLDPVRLGLGVQAFIQIETGSHTAETHAAFRRLVAARPEITGAWTMTGEADYLLRIYCTDLAALNRLTQEVLLPHPSIGRVHSQIVMEELKDDSALPL